jgi:hypothetical protein
MAAPMADPIPLATAGPAPTSGTLANQVGWSVNVGAWDGTTYAFSDTDGPQVFSFDRLVSVQFGIAGLDQTGECVQVPDGATVDSLSPAHSWDPATRLVCATATSGRSDESTFTYPNAPFQLELDAVGAPGSRRGASFVAVTYDLPEASIAVPANGASYPQGATVAADFTCKPGTGQIIAAQASAPKGAPIDTNLPGAHQFTLTCIDEYGTTVTASATYNVVAPTLTGRAFGLSVGGLVNLLRTPDTGPVATRGASTTSTPCITNLTVGLVISSGRAFAP